MKNYIYFLNVAVFFKLLTNDTSFITNTGFLFSSMSNIWKSHNIVIIFIYGRYFHFSPENTG